MSGFALGTAGDSQSNNGLRLPSSHDDIDIVVATSGSAESTAFFEAWHDVFRPHHVTVVQYGSETNPKMRPPPGLDVDVYSRADVKRLLGGRSVCISAKDSASRCFGWLISSKKYIFTLTDECTPLPPSHFPDSSHLYHDAYSSHTSPSSSSSSSHSHSSGGSSSSFLGTNGSGSYASLPAIARHMRNLLRPSTPFHFNTLYDPFEDSTDFVRGYPFSLREGVPTVLSHGLWLNQADYDAPTLLVKPNERNGRLVEAVQTVPKGVLYPMSAFNLAFNREAIGPAMYFPPVADGQPIGFHDDMWAGWCSKVIADHLGYGVKSGMPYVWRSKPSNAFANLRKEYKGIFWQEEIVPFFQSLQLPSDATTASQCYLEIARQVKEQLGKSDPSLSRLADAMVMWTEAWSSFQPGGSLPS